MANRSFEAVYSSPLGELRLVSDGAALTELRFPRETNESTEEGGCGEIDDVLEAALSQLHAYFHEGLQEFDLPLNAEGTTFQKRVWAALREIPYGTTTSYAAIARAIGRPNACRAVGAANGRNPLAIIVPCHRVIGANGSLVGFGGGLDTKQFLLDHEQRVCAANAAEWRITAAAGT